MLSLFLWTDGAFLRSKIAPGNFRRQAEKPESCLQLWNHAPLLLFVLERWRGSHPPMPLRGMRVLSRPFVCRRLSPRFTRLCRLALGGLRFAKTIIKGFRFAHPSSRIVVSRRSIHSLLRLLAWLTSRRKIDYQSIYPCSPRNPQGGKTRKLPWQLQESCEAIFLSRSITAFCFAADGGVSPPMPLRGMRLLSRPFVCCFRVIWSHKIVLAIRFLSCYNE